MRFSHVLKQHMCSHLNLPSVCTISSIKNNHTGHKGESQKNESIHIFIVKVYALLHVFFAAIKGIIEVKRIRYQ